MRVVHVIPAVGEESSGPSYSVTRLCASLSDMGEDLTLAAMDLAAPPTNLPFLELFPIGRGPRRAGRSPQMYRWLRNEAATGSLDIVHSHGMWQINSIYPQWSVRGTSAKIVVSPRGALSPWAMTHGSRLKRVMWPLLQRPSLRAAACFHATADAELQQIRELGFTQPVAVIPNGVDIPSRVSGKPPDFRTLLFLGRIHPKKGVDILLHAWRAVMGSFPDWRLQIIGSDAVYGDAPGYLREMQALSARLGLERVSFEAPRYGAAKWDAYGEAELFVLPSHSENFGMTVAESLAAGTPVVVTKGTPWEEIETHGCGWWIDVGAAPLAGALEVALAEPRHALSARGLAGRTWMAKTHSWPTIAANMRLVYHWLLGGTDAPDCVKH